MFHLERILETFDGTRLRTMPLELYSKIHASKFSFFGYLN